MSFTNKIIAITVSLLSIIHVNAEPVDPTGTYYNLLGKISVTAKIVNCKPLNRLGAKKIDVIVQDNNKLSIGFEEGGKVLIFNDDSGKWLSDNGNYYKPTNYVVNGAIFSRTGNNLIISRSDTGINYLESAKSLLEIERRQLRWRVEDALKKVFNDADAVDIVANLIKMPQHIYTPTKFDMRMTLKTNGTATLKEHIVAETNFLIPQNPHILSGTCKIRLVTKRSVSSVQGSSPVPL